MTRRFVLTYILSLGLTVSTQSSVHAQPKVPPAPTIYAVSSSNSTSGKVDVTVKILGSKISSKTPVTGGVITAGGKSCPLAESERSCVLKGLNYKITITIRAYSTNRYGTSKSSKKVTYTTGMALILPASGCPVKRSELLNLAKENGLTEIEVSSVTGKCTKKTSKALLSLSVQKLAIKKFPGLNGKVTSTVNGKKFLEYYVDALEFGFELLPGEVNMWNDPLIRIFLESGFPMNKSDLGSAIRNDERYATTYRARLEAAAFGIALACAFGSQTACDGRAAAQARVDALGPLVK